eukprot:14445177-Alexandrium_andersonii.AAC.1
MELAMELAVERRHRPVVNDRVRAMGLPCRCKRSQCWLARRSATVAAGPPGPATGPWPPRT